MTAAVTKGLAPKGVALAAMFALCAGLTVETAEARGHHKGHSGRHHSGGGHHHRSHSRGNPCAALTGPEQQRCLFSLPH